MIEAKEPHEILLELVAEAMHNSKGWNDGRGPSVPWAEQMTREPRNGIRQIARDGLLRALELLADERIELLANMPELRRALEAAPVPEGPVTVPEWAR